MSTTEKAAQLGREHFEILAHTKRNHRYCGDSPEMRDLVNLGLMQSLGKVAWCPDEYFAMTPAGESTLRDMRQAVSQ